MSDIQQTSRREITFLGEQNGPPESEFKELLIPLLRSHRRVTCAYLVRVRYDQSSIVSVALCMSGSKRNDGALLQCVAEVFSQVFKLNEVLDMMFITKDQEGQIAEVAKPFYVK